jgi:hypothetical protein
MVATYTCNAIIFPEDSTDYMDNYDQFGGITGKELSFNVWLDLNFDLAYQHIFNGVQIDNRISYSAITYTYIKQNYDDSMMGWDKSHQGIFDTFNYQTENAGWRWYNSDWVQSQGFLEIIWGVTKTERINNDYHKYLQNIGVEDMPKGNLIDTITLLLTNVWQGFTQFVRLLSFTNIPNMPLWVVGLLNVFFIPMWIVLIIGIAPFVMEMIKTISSIIEPWIPW